MKRGKKSIKRTPVPASDVVVYRGPTRLYKVPADEMITANCSSIFALSGSSVGIQAVIYAGFITSNSDWGSFVGAYNEFRIIAIAANSMPRCIEGDASVVHSEGLGIVTSNGVNPSPFTALSQMAQYDYKRLHTAKPWSLEWTMSTVEEGQWGPTSGTPSNHGYLVAFFPGATTTSTSYGSFTVDWLVQFRGRS